MSSSWRGTSRGIALPLRGTRFLLSCHGLLLGMQRVESFCLPTFSSCWCLDSATAFRLADEDIISVLLYHSTSLKRVSRPISSHSEKDRISPPPLTTMKASTSPSTRSRADLQCLLHCSFSEFISFNNDHVASDAAFPIPAPI